MPTLGETEHGEGLEQTPLHSFTLRLEGDLTDELVEHLYKQIDDVTFGVSSGVPYAAFDRVAPTLAQAVASAVRDMEREGARVLRVEPDDLVNIPEIARRTQRSRESIRLLIEGKRGPGRFPPPAAWIGGHPVWRWGDVALWWGGAFKEPAIDVSNAAFLTALNGALDVRRAAAKLPTDHVCDVVVNVLKESEFRSSAGDAATAAAAVTINVVIGGEDARSCSG